MKLPALLIATLLLSACATQPPDAVNQPNVVKQVRPSYPYYAWSHRIAGFVSFAFDVDAQGKVSEMRILQSEPRGLFEAYVIAAVSQWRYEKNKPIKDMKMTIRFTLRQETGPGSSTIIF